MPPFLTGFDLQLTSKKPMPGLMIVWRLRARWSPPVLLCLQYRAVSFRFLSLPKGVLSDLRERERERWERATGTGGLPYARSLV